MPMIRFRVRLLWDRVKYTIIDLLLRLDKNSWPISLSHFLSLKKTIQISFKGNVSIIPSGLPHQMFMILIGTCGMGSDPSCCEVFFPPSKKLVLEGGPTKIF